MRKRVMGRQLGRERDTRRALFRSLIISLIEYGKIETTKAKVKAVIPNIDRLVNLAKDESISSQRRLYARLGNNTKATKKLVAIAPKLGDRRSGYARLVPLPTRRGDGAQMARLEWSTEPVVVEKKSKKIIKKPKLKLLSKKNEKLAEKSKTTKK